mmetsp:Transcript_12052/g.36170  ORF Transcript_12052/g.36170 Transcript_12052/m.36170 type:complete len:229 (+) Transcript_12052:190-876(+)
MHSLGTKPHTHNRKARSTSRIVSDNVFALAFPIGRMMKLYESPQQQDELINPGQLGVWLVVLDSLMVILPKLSTIWDWDRELGGATWGGFAKVAGWDSLSHDEVMVTSGLNACPRRRRNVTVSSLRTRSGAANRAFLPSGVLNMGRSFSAWRTLDSMQYSTSGGSGTARSSAPSMSRAACTSGAKTCCAPDMAMLRCSPSTSTHRPATRNRICHSLCLGSPHCGLYLW